MSERECEAPGCDKEAKGRRYCSMHAKRMTLHGSLELPERKPVDYAGRFWSRVNKSGPVPAVDPTLGPCWLWERGEQHGYGAFQIGSRSIRAHRWSYEQEHGPLADGAQLDHECRVKRCVRPGHLRLTDHSSNQENLANVRTNTVTGVRGVTIHKGKYLARVGSKGAMHWLGYFDTLDAAAAAVKAKRLELHTYNKEDRG